MKKINAVLIDVISTALFYFQHHDNCFKKYCLQTAAWNGVEKLKKLIPSITEPLLAPVNECINECAKARKKMPKINIRYKEYSVAADSFTNLAQQLDQISEDDPFLKENIKKDDIASHNLFVNLATTVSKII